MNTMNGRVFVIVLTIIVLFVGVWMFRYNIIPAGIGGGGGSILVAAYRLDRWTGKVICILRQNSFDVEHQGKSLQ